MEKKYSRGNLYERISKLFSVRNITLLSILIFILLLLPVLYLSFVNRASGDDYGYGAYTRAAWMGAHSLTAVGKAAYRTVKQYYYGWQGTWFSIFVFSLQPEVFSDNAYVIVAFLMLFLWIGSTFYLFRQILYRNMRLDKWCCLLITILFLIISIEFIPSTKSAIYWFNGCAHYMLPFAMCQMVAAWLLKYVEAYGKCTLAGIIIFMTLLGGSNYQAALFVLIAACFTGISAWILKKDKRVLTLLLPVFMELTGLMVSMKAPGNKARAGEEFGLSFLKAAKTIGCSFLYGIRDIGTYLRERPLIFVGLLLIFIILSVSFHMQKTTFCFQHPIWLCLMLFCLYSAMQAPAIYAGVEVSRGVLNTNFQVFLLTALGILLIFAQKLSQIIKGKQKQAGNGILMAAAFGILLCMILGLFCRSNIKTSTSYVCLTYITSGQAKDYRQQMELQTKLMEDENTEDVILPFINDVQGPLMHMPVTADKEAWTNTVTKEFYGKNSVVAMERPKWMELYGDSAD